MNVRSLFSKSAEVLQAKFEQTQAYVHPGTTGSAREDAFKDFLRERIPARFGIGTGHVIGPNSPDSRQADVIIYDTNICAPLVADQSVQIYPIEGVSGIIEVKSRLSKGELIDGLAKIKDFKSLVPTAAVQTRSGPMEVIGAREKPFGIIFAYSLADNSLNSLCGNLAEYEKALGDVSYSANLVVVLNEGIILHRNQQSHNDVILTDQMQRQPLGLLPLQWKKATLFEFFTRFLDMLVNTQLSKVELSKYRLAVERLGSHLVRNHDRLFRHGSTARRRLTADFVDKVYKWCADQPLLSANELNRLTVPDYPGIEQHFGPDGAKYARLYNPAGLSRPTIEMIKNSVNGKIAEPCLIATFVIEIDGASYAIPPYYTEGETEEIPGATYEDL